MTVYKPYTFLAAILVLISILNTSVAAKPDWDGPWERHPNPDLNIFKFLENFTNQRSRTTNMGRVGRRSLLAEQCSSWLDCFATQSWFDGAAVSPEMIRNRFKKIFLVYPVPQLIRPRSSELARPSPYTFRKAFAHTFHFTLGARIRV